jgi:hypothetical protein
MGTRARKKNEPMWKVVVTEIQDANALEPFAVPPGAFFVSTERLSRTVENLDLQALINALDRTPAPQAYGREDRPASGKRTPWWPSPVHLAAHRETHSGNLEPKRRLANAKPPLSKTDP